eukprot:13081665-Ditylum_brightwellii.AAC.1
MSVCCTTETCDVFGCPNIKAGGGAGQNLRDCIPINYSEGPSSEEPFSNEIFFGIRSCNVVSYRRLQCVLDLLITNQTRPTFKGNLCGHSSSVLNSIAKALFCSLIAQSVQLFKGCHVCPFPMFVIVAHDFRPFEGDTIGCAK